MKAFSFDTTHSIICELGASRMLPALCADRGLKHIMLVTDPGLVTAGIIPPIQQNLENNGVNVLLYQDVQADPPEQVVLAAVAEAEQANIDGVIGIGGGSSMDVAKLIAVLCHSPQQLADIYGVGNVKGHRLALIQVPTTAGTGSEVTPIAIVTTGETTKTGVVAKQLLPDLAVLDAELTLGLPAPVTAATGIDAMVHAIEAYTSIQRKNIYSDMLARQALQLLSENIVTAVTDGKNVQARGNMLLGSMLAGQAFANAPVAAVHALAYPLGGHYHIPHGLSNSLVLPAVLRFNASAAEQWYAELLPCVDKQADSGGDQSQQCERFILRMETLISQVKLPMCLRDMDIAESDLTMLAEDAMLQTRLLVNNPREITLQDALGIYQSSY